MKLPQASAATIETAKLGGYLLDLSHPGGAAKARYMIARGFSLEEPGTLERALLEHPLRHDAVLRASDAFGDKYEVRCAFRTPDGRNPCVRSFWRVPAEGAPYLVTAYPA